MGKAQKKTGKGRLDKYYKLAKEQGYRARSAFKLIQLNKKYSFLESARCCIDLCAAPGGWLQVAAKYMPANSLIVGVDLVPIKPIPRVATFAADITTPQCRNLIRGELKDWKADVVLHDGAPNVGTAWVQDAYSQSELVLMSLKLAVEFLMKGGIFITKVFRSVDYNNLIWVFGQLFGHVEATKPPSSRNVSAEIFVVCRDFLAPKHIDPKFLDPKYVFRDVAASMPAPSGNVDNVQANVFQPEKKRRHRSGYADGDYTLFKSAPVEDFIKSTDPITLLGSVNRFVFESEEAKQWLLLDVTTADIKLNCEDLKVLGKGDFKMLMKWRTAVRQEMGVDVRMKPAEDSLEPATDAQDAEEPTIENEIERMNAEARGVAKRQRRKANEVKVRALQRMQLQMTAPLEIGVERTDDVLRDGLSELLTSTHDINPEGYHTATEEENGDQSSDEHVDSGDEDTLNHSALEHELDDLYDAYKERLAEKDSKAKAKESRRKNKDRDVKWSGLGDESGTDDASDEEAGGWEDMEEAKYGSGQQSSESDTDDEYEKVEVKSKSKKRQRQVESDLHRASKSAKVVEGSDVKTTAMWFNQKIFYDLGSDFDDIPLSDDEGGSQVDSQAYKTTTQSPDEPVHLEDDFTTDKALEEVDGDIRGGKNDLKLTTAEAITLAQQLVNRKKTKTQLINEGFNRYSLNSKEHLPSWFLDDESKHYKSNIPISKEAVAALRAKERALDARPIKKIAEARARKKLKAVQKLQKAMTKAESINQTSDLSEREKAKQIQTLMRKGLSKSKGKKADIKVVVAKGANRGLKGRPRGVKGRYTMVDARMKKEVRAQKRQKQAKRGKH